MQTYTVRIGLREPSTIMLSQLDDAMEQKRFLPALRLVDDDGYITYHYHTGTKNKQQLCALVYSIAERIQPGPVVLIDEQA
ncbi:hypothetical protein KGP17_15875 [Serratia sp. JSRIV001]|uniref:hypothetical protein n=1 Tax=unclassified Serratia (in: enterobacteria) TaxID=2647522 RepID=UPI001CBFF44D|nr:MULTISPECIES: hypothetical protein [unclassified Serratia (in: enterobacteria)]UAN43956.1 hypothetical protein KGP17_15875 [Serratia sp. JSRIV001]UAN53532.1 hypothetical protein KGP26_10950 [Serratia sp. JSRIV002]UAN58153.1 hypothetical protein KGP21_03455 [Serratia sp. JSRIV004]